MNQTAKRGQPNKPAEALPADKLNNIVSVDFAKKKASKANQDQITTLRINIKDIVDRLSNKERLDEMLLKAISNLDYETFCINQAETNNALVTEDVLKTYRKYKTTFKDTVILMQLGGMMFAFEEDARWVGHAYGELRRLSDSKQTPYFSFHSSDSERIDSIKKLKKTTIIM